MERDRALSENALISQLNPVLQTRNWESAEPILRQLIAITPGRWEYQQTLGNAQLNLGKYGDALATYDKAISMAENTAKGDPKADPARVKDALAQMLTNEGNAYIKLKKTDKAVEAYRKAAELGPNPATAYFNLCATQYNAGNTKDAMAACDEAIAADPNKADAHFIKGSLLISNSGEDKSGKVQAPPGTVEALSKYLELAPNGPHANDVKQMLDFIGAKR